MKNYTYPIEEHWTKEEIIAVIQFLTLIERAYESKVNKNQLLKSYKDFKKIVPSKSEEKRLFTQFKKQSGYACYKVVKKAQKSMNKMISMS